MTTSIHIANGGKFRIARPDNTVNLVCCDCGLKHTFRFEVHKNFIEAQVWRDQRATVQLRRRMMNKHEGIFEKG